MSGATTPRPRARVARGSCGVQAYGSAGCVPDGRSGGRATSWLGPGGVLYAGNTGTAYAIRPDSPRPACSPPATRCGPRRPSPMTARATGARSISTSTVLVARAGLHCGRRSSPGYVISSPAIGSDGTVYVGSFDSKLYALDPATGAVRWSFATSDHIYSSPALGQDSAGHPDGVYIASADGSVYALSPSGRLRWRYDTGDAIRSSPVLGTRPGRRAPRHRVRRVIERVPLRAERRHRAAALVIRHHSQRSRPPRSQRPQRLAGTRHEGRVHRGRARLRRLRPLRLLPPPPRSPLLDQPGPGPRG